MENGTVRWKACLQLLSAVIAAAGVAACGPPPASAPLAVRLAAETRQVLSIDPPSVDFYEGYARLEQEGPLLDPILVHIADDPGASGPLRANALLLLAERQPAIALFVLRRALLTARNPQVRAGAVFGLQRLLPGNESAANALRMALGDPDRRVRANALQALDFRDAADIRRLLRRERDYEVRAVAEQLLALAESRGAPLLQDAAGGYRTLRLEGQPRLVFRPVWSDTTAGLALGELWVEAPFQQPRRLADSVEVVAGVVPAFFSPDRSAVVFEANRHIHVCNVRSGEPRLVGAGMAPRPLPLTDQFVYVQRREPEERPVGASQSPGRVLAYNVFSAGFGGAPPDSLGELRARAQPDMHGHASPVRWMVVADDAEGFVLRGRNVEDFLLPHPALRPRPVRGTDPSAPSPRTRDRLRAGRVTAPRAKTASAEP